jgi:hypothetical protein
MLPRAGQQGTVVDETTLSEVMELLERGEKEFLSRVGSPVLVIAVGLKGRLEQPNPGKETLRVEKRHASFIISTARIAPLERRGRHSFPVVTVGRAKQNDVVLDVEGISKIHATFAQDADGAWSITDTGSKNGTLLDGQLLEARASRPVGDGSEIVFGNAVTSLFFQPRALLEWAKVNRTLYVK